MTQGTWLPLSINTLQTTNADRMLVAALLPPASVLHSGRAPVSSLICEDVTEHWDLPSTETPPGAHQLLTFSANAVSAFTVPALTDHQQS